MSVLTIMISLYFSLLFRLININNTIDNKSDKRSLNKDDSVCENGTL